MAKKAVSGQGLGAGLLGYAEERLAAARRQGTREAMETLSLLVEEVASVDSVAVRIRLRIGSAAVAAAAGMAAPEFAAVCAQAGADRRRMREMMELAARFGDYEDWAAAVEWSKLLELRQLAEEECAALAAGETVRGCVDAKALSSMSVRQLREAVQGNVDPRLAGAQRRLALLEEQLAVTKTRLRLTEKDNAELRRQTSAQKHARQLIEWQQAAIDLLTGSFDELERVADVIRGYGSGQARVKGATAADCAFARATAASSYLGWWGAVRNRFLARFRDLEKSMAALVPDDVVSISQEGAGVRRPAREAERARM